MGMATGIMLSPCALSGGASWVPSSLSSSVLFLRSDKGVTLNGTDVSAWASQVGSYSFAQGTAAKQPAWGAATGPGGQPGLTFTLAAQDTLACASVTMPTTQFHWCVLNEQAPTADSQIFSCAGSKNICEPSQGASDFISWYTTGLARVYSATAAASGAQVLAWLASGTNVTFYRNWVSLGTVAAGGTACASGALGAWIGSNQDLGGWSNKIVSEYGLLNAAPSAGELAQLAAYTLARYGV